MIRSDNQNRCSGLGGWLVAVALFALAAGPLCAQRNDDVAVEVGGTNTVAVAGYVRHTVVPETFLDAVDVTVGTETLTFRGKQLGRGRIVAWDRNGNSHIFTVNVVGGGQTDAELERAVAALLAADPVTRDARITVRANGGDVTLTGLAATQLAADRAAALARQKARSVVNSLSIGATPPRPLNGDLLVPPVVAPGGALTPLRLPSVQVDGGIEGQVIELRVNEAVALSVPTQLKRIMAAAPEIADVVVMPPREAVVIGKQVGETTMIVWYVGGDAYLGEGQRVTFPVRVIAPPPSADDGGLAAKRAQAMEVLTKEGISGVEIVTAGSAQALNLLLLGNVANRDQVRRAETIIAAIYGTARITNLLRVPLRTWTDADLDAKARSLERLLAQELPNSEIHVQCRMDAGTERLRVWLSGMTFQPADRIKAEDLVRFDVGPTAEINNNLDAPLPPPPPDILNLGKAGSGEPSGPPPPPSKPIMTAILEAMGATGVRFDDVRVKVFGDLKRVMLSGPTRSDDDKQALVEAVTDAVAPYGNYEVKDDRLVVRVSKVTTTVQIVELTNNDSLNLGFSYGLPTGGSTSGSGSSSGSSSTNQTTQLLATNGELAVYGQRRPGDPFKMLEGFASSIRALVTQNKARILSSPVISSDNGGEAQWEVTDDIPIPSTTQSGQGAIGTSVEFRPVGIRLRVTPQIQWGDPDSQIQLTLDTEVSAVDYGKAATISGTIVPAITKRRTQTQVTVDDHETLVLAGLTTESEQKNVSKLPFLGDIPLLGELFKYTSKSGGKTTIVVVMTPRIVY